MDAGKREVKKEEMNEKELNEYIEKLEKFKESVLAIGEEKVYEYIDMLITERIKKYPNWNIMAILSVKDFIHDC